MAKYACTVCGWVYDEELGCEEWGVAPGTKWDDLPEDLVCVLCGVALSEFELVQE